MCKYSKRMSLRLLIVTSRLSATDIGLASVHRNGANAIIMKLSGAAQSYTLTIILPLKVKGQGHISQHFTDFRVRFLIIIVFQFFCARTDTQTETDTRTPLKAILTWLACSNINKLLTTITRVYTTARMLLPRRHVRFQTPECYA